MSIPPLPSSFDDNEQFHEETIGQRLWRHIKEEPLVPIGCAVTTWALLGATRSIKAGTQNKTNQMFRFRIYGQTFTIAALIAGSFYYDTDRKRRREFQGVLAAKKAEEKKQAWIRELEARDREDRALEDKKEARARRAFAARMSAAEVPIPQVIDVPKEDVPKGPGVLDAVKELAER